MKYLLFFLSILITHQSLGQNANNYLTSTAVSSLNFTINTQTEIESTNTVANSVRITFKTKDADRKVNARISSFTTPAGFSTTTYPIQLKWNNDNGTLTNLQTSALTLTNTDQRLFSKSSQNAVINVNYDLIYSNTNWDYPPGTYNYTIQFTLASGL